MDFKKIKPEEITENAVKLIGTDWMLITAGNKEKFNTMTASWGFMGFMWNKPCVACFIRPERYTFDFIERCDTFTLSFFEDRYKDILKFCGSKSGRDVNKVEETKLSPYFLENNSVGFSEAKLILNCKKLYAQQLNEKDFFEKSIISTTYQNAGYHKMYIAEITDALKK